MANLRIASWLSILRWAILIISKTTHRCVELGGIVCFMFMMDSCVVIKTVQDTLMET